MDKKETWLTLGGTSSGALTNASAKCEPRMAIEAATRLFGFYRASEANDPETFIAGAAAMLAQYPEAVVAKVCDPIRGLPATNKFLPAIAEIREACEREMVWHYAVERREKVRRETLAGRQDGHSAPIGSFEHQRVVESFARLKAEFEANVPADPRPKPFTLKLEPGVDAFADRGPPSLSAQVREKYATLRTPVFDQERDDDQSFDDREFLP